MISFTIDIWFASMLDCSVSFKDIFTYVASDTVATACQSQTPRKKRVRIIIVKYWFLLRQVATQIVLGQINLFFSKCLPFLHNLQLQWTPFILFEKYFELFKCVLSANTALFLVKWHRKYLSVLGVCPCK